MVCRYIQQLVGSTNDVYIVRLGNSGLKVSKIILGTMQYGLKEWADWVLDEDEAVQHIKYACVLPCSDNYLNANLHLCHSQIRRWYPDL